jgi:DNA (cytosine-5)-methyltransferase 1
MLNVLDLFSGIGGFSLGFERAGWHTIGFCEIEPSCQLVLAKHWPNTPIISDIRNLNATSAPDSVDIICGGFPCQDISVAGKKAGITGSRSGLWKEYARLINELKPRYAIIENVANLRSSGLVTVLTDLWQIGYDAEWHCVPASALGAPHRRDRIWIIAYPNRERCNGGRNHREKRYIQGDQERFDSKIYEEWHRGQPGTGSVCEILADTVRAGLEGHSNLSGDARPRGQILQPSQVSLLRSLGGNPWWGNEPEISRLKDNGLNPDWVEWLMGFPIGWTEGGSRKERLCSLGNAVVPIIPEMIAFSINEYEKTYVHTNLSRQHDCETV